MPKNSGTYSKTKLEQDISTLQSVLLIYLVHHPSHPYEIAKKFKEAGPLWNVPKTRGIVRASKLYSQFYALGNVMGGLVERKPLPKDPRRKVEYILRWDRLLDPRSDRWKHEIQECASWIKALSRPEIPCIASIANISKFDLLTVFLYLEVLLREIELYLSPWIQKSLRDPSGPSRTRFLGDCLLDFGKAEELLRNWEEARRTVEAVRGLVSSGIDQFIFGQRGLDHFLSRGLFRLEKHILKPLSNADK